MAAGPDTTVCRRRNPGGDVAVNALPGEGLSKSDMIMIHGPDLVIAKSEACGVISKYG